MGMTTFSHRPRDAVPLSWMHPDLRRLLYEQDQKKKENQVSRMGEYETVLRTKYLQMAMAKAEQEEQRQRLLAALTKTEENLKCMDENMVTSAALLEDVKNQRYFHQNNYGSRRYQVSSAQLESVATSFSSCQSSSQSGVLDVHFWHLFTQSGFWGWSSNSAVTASSGNAPEESSHTKLEEECSSEQTRDSVIRIFLNQWFPLLLWSGSGNRKRVCKPYFFEQPCQMETQTPKEEESDRCVRCEDPKCLYWHSDQLAHLKTVTRQKLKTLLLQCCTLDDRRCIVASFISVSLDLLMSSRSVSDFCIRLVFTAAEIIRLQWHKTMVEVGLQGAHQVWMTPILVDDFSSKSSSSASGRCREDLLREPVEVKLWNCIVSRQRKFENSTFENVSTQVFTEFQNAISWRFLVRVSSKTIIQEKWFTQHGWNLFPCSPHVALHFVMSRSHGKDWEPKNVVDVCLHVASTLTAQCAGSLYVSVESGGAQFTALASRYIAFMLAYTAVQVVHQESSNLEHTKRLLSAATEPDRFFLTPIALHNMSLLYAALLQWEHLRGVDILPLGAFSDQVFVLNESFQHSSHNHGVSVLNTHLQLLNRNHDDRRSRSFNEELKSSAQLSLMRCFNSRLSAVDQLMLKSSMLSEVTQAALWMEYLEMVHRHDSSEPYEELIRALMSSPIHPNHLLYLLLHWRKQSIDGPSEHSPEDLGNQKSDAGASGVELASSIILGCHKLHDDESIQKYLLQHLSHPQLCYDGNAVILLLMALLRHCSKNKNFEWFSAAVEKALRVLVEQHLMWWSPADSFFEDVVGAPHFVALLVYRLVPALLRGRSGPEETHTWRCKVVFLARSCGAQHPLFHTSEWLS